MLVVVLQYWQDDYLQWNKTEYGGLTQIVLSPELVWLPDFGIENRCVVCCVVSVQACSHRNVEKEEKYSRKC